MEVKDIVKPAVVVSESDTFESALAAMQKQQTNTLLVVDSEGELTGEVTVTDLLNAIVPEHLGGDDVLSHFSDDKAIQESIDQARYTPVGEFMSHDYTALELGDDLLTVFANAIAHERARIPVVNKDNRPVGIISRRGLKAVIEKFL